MNKVLIIGGGITGLSVAWKLSEEGCHVTILESEDTIGGLARSIKIDDYYLDVGPHSFFSDDKEIFNRVKNLFDQESEPLPYVKRNVKMLFLGKFVDYPLSAKSVLLQTGILPPILSCLSFVKSYILNSFKKKKTSKNLTVEEWAIENFGNYLFKNFFKPYTEQFWKIDTADLSHRVIPSSKKMDFAKTLKHLFINKYLEISKREPGKLSLVERESLPSYYPKNGFGEITKKIGQIIIKNKGIILTSTRVNKIVFNKNNTFSIETKDKSFTSDILISTIPINKFINQINPSPKEEILNSAKKLDYLSLIVLYIVTDKENVLNCQYCYFLNRTYNRISDMNLFSKNLSPKGKNILSVEISCHYDSDLWNLTKEEIFKKCIKEIVNDNILKIQDVLEYKIFKFPSVYPIYRKNYELDLLKIEEYLKTQKNLFSIGRQGQFYYGDIDQMIRIGFDTANNIIKTRI
jgi:protoporphyrinogen oxidase